MSRGYITIAINSGTEDYIKSAYGLALSLKATQKDVNALSIVVENEKLVPKQYRKAFDKIIVLPNKNLSVNTTWKVENYYQLYEASPYDETVTLDADMLFVSDVSNWWNDMCRYDVDVTTHVYNYRGEIIKNNCLRKDFYRVGLPDVHNGFLYFKKSTLASKLFKQIEKYASDWEITTKRIYGLDMVHYSSDSALNIAIKELGIESECIHDESFPTFVHMKTVLQGWKNATSKDWTKYVNYEFDKNMGLKIDGFTIRYPFHYHNRNFISEDLIKQYEEFLEVSNCF